jgi:hypothetical protein
MDKLNSENPELNREIRGPAPEAESDFYNAAATRPTEPEKRLPGNPIDTLPHSERTLEAEVHDEVPGVTLKTIIPEDERSEKLNQILESLPDTTKPGVADELNKEMERLVSE